MDTNQADHKHDLMHITVAFTTFILKMASAGSSETLLAFSQTTQHHILLPSELGVSHTSELSQRKDGFLMFLK
jgi:hypothetical protein